MVVPDNLARAAYMVWRVPELPNPVSGSFQGCNEDALKDKSISNGLTQTNRPKAHVCVCADKKGVPQPNVRTHSDWPVRADAFLDQIWVTFASRGTLSSLDTVLASLWPAWPFSLLPN
jgi:hypothetical protein